jgi:SAM-dependent methyltransferase
MLVPERGWTLDTRSATRVVDLPSAAEPQQIAVLPLSKPGDGSLGVAVDLTWIRQFHYCLFRGESLDDWRAKYAAAKKVKVQADIEALTIWPVVALDCFEPSAVLSGGARGLCRDPLPQVALKDLRAGLKFDPGAPTTMLQFPELLALIDGVPFRFPEAYFIGNMETLTAGGTLNRNPDWFRTFDGLPTAWEGRCCEQCGSSMVSARHIIGPSRLVRCSECGLEYDQPQALFQAAALDKYASDVHDQRKSAKAIVRAEQSAQILVNGLRAVAPDLIRRPLLDIGCASGELLYVLREKYGWANEALFGVERSRRSVEIATRKYGLNAQAIEPVHACFPEGSLSVVTIVNTIEHLPNPRAVLAHARRRLAPGGCLLIATVPNVSCFNSFCFPEGFIAKNFPDGQHHFQFTPATLSRLCTTEGFQIARMNGETRESVLGKVRETAIWLAYSCGVPLPVCSDEKEMLREFKAIVTKKQCEIVEQQGPDYRFTVRDGDFDSPDALIAFWRREIWPSPYLSDEFDLWCRKT